MTIYDDSDIKIAGREPMNSPLKEDEAYDGYEEQRLNGNQSRALRLGLTLCCELDKIKEIPDITTQRKLLTIFSYAVAVEQLLDNDNLVRTTLNVFYDSLKKSDPELYDLMSSSGAFTFYYLEHRRTNTSAQNVARAYAMLSGREGDEALIIQGVEIIETNLEFTRRLVEELGFVK